MATRKIRIIVKGVGGVKLSNDAELDKWLGIQSVACLLDDDGDQVLGFQSLAPGGTYTLGPLVKGKFVSIVVETIRSCYRCASFSLY